MSSTKSFLPFLLLSSLVISVQGNIQMMEIPTYFDCGPFQCLDEPGVKCNRGLRKCECPPGDIGDARIACAVPHTDCLCTLFGDPHINTFDGFSTYLRLPCAHTLANLTTRTDDVPGGCQVNAIGMSRLKDGTSNPSISFERQVDIEVVAGSTRFTARIIAGQDTVTDLDDNGDFNVREANRNGITIIVIRQCNVRILFREDHGYFALQTSINETYNTGLCGVCEEEFAGSIDNAQPGPYNYLEVLLESLTTSSPIDNTDINVYPTCSHLTATAKLCPDNRTDFAVRVCGTMLISQPVRDCLVGQGGVNTVEEYFTLCIEAVCSPIVKSCPFYVGLFQGCPIEWNAQRSNPDFCNQPGSGLS